VLAGTGGGGTLWVASLLRRGRSVFKRKPFTNRATCLLSKGIREVCKKVGGFTFLSRVHGDSGWSSHHFREVLSNEVGVQAKQKEMV